MKPTLNEKFVVYLTLLSGLALSAVAVYYSVSGLTAIFAAAVVPIIIMGITLEVSKIVATVWLKQNWDIAPLSIKAYLCAAIALLMIITSMGIFGFLSKAHSDQNLVSGDVIAKIAVYDEKIKTERENIDANRKALKQLDESVDQVMGRSQDEKGAEKAVAIRKAQQKERSRLAQDITDSQKKITVLNEERAPIAAEVRKVEAEVGPIKYIAAFVYGATDQTILEKAVTWVIITIIIVFDPLALILLLASQISFQQFRKRESTGGVVMDKDGTIIGLKVPEAEKSSSTGVTAQEVSPMIPEAVEMTTSTVAYQFIDESDGEIEKYVGSGENTLPPLVVANSEPKDNVPLASRDKDTRSILQKLYDAETAKQSMEKGYIQNEEQAESNVWSTVNSISQHDYINESQIRLENHISEIVELIQAGELTIEEVPQYIQKEVREKL
jgi:hypothetical protein